jgi:hypothetical protein
MIRTLVCLALLSASNLAAIPAMAADRLSFCDLEHEQLRNPLTGSNVAFSEVYHTPQSYMAPSLDTLITAIPPGTPVADGDAILQRAGARCQGTTTCTYRDVQTVDEYLDDILWTVHLASANGNVTGISVDRAWQRH